MDEIYIDESEDDSEEEGLSWQTCCATKIKDLYKKSQYFFQAPIVKFYLNLYSYIAFLIILSITILQVYMPKFYDFRDWRSNALAIWILAFILEELVIIGHEKKFKLAPTHDKVRINNFLCKLQLHLKKTIRDDSYFGNKFSLSKNILPA